MSRHPRALGAEEDRSSSAPPDIPPPPERAASPHQRGAEEKSLAGTRVVVCEDEGVTQLQLRRALTRAGFQVVGAPINGQEGVEVVLRERPEIVLMDIRMPIMDGLEAAQRIMAEYPVCIVMLTAYSGEEYRAQAREIGASGYLIKPVTGDALLPAVGAALDAFRARSK